MHECFQNSTLFDLVVEFYEDLFEEDPKAMLDAARGDDGEIVFEETGDDLIDKWERELSQGKTPDLTEGYSKETLAELQKKHDTKVLIADKMQDLLGMEINESYDSLSHREFKGRILGK